MYSANRVLINILLGLVIAVVAGVFAGSSRSAEVDSSLQDDTTASPVVIHDTLPDRS